MDRAAAAMGLIDMDARMGEMAWRARVTASAMGLPGKFLAGIGWRKVSDGHWQLYNSWMGENYHTGEKDVPLALFFEEGTKVHAVIPVYAKALSWVTPAGRRAFSRGHLVRGLPASEAMASAVRDTMRIVADYVRDGLAGDLEGEERGG